jgi:hypothetical protein
MAILNASGITFGDSTSYSSRYTLIPQSSVAIFFQASAPTGWTQVTTHNDKALRVVSGTGGGSGGSISFTSAFPNAGAKPISGTANVAGTVGNTTLDVNMIPSHNHPSGLRGFQQAPQNPDGSFNAGPWGRPGSYDPINSTYQGYGANVGHAHPWTGSGPWSTSIDLRCQYIDTIACSFN